MSMGKRLLFFVCKLMLFAAFVGLCVFFLDLKAINRQLLTLLHHPFTLAGMALLYGMAFCLRAFAWKWYVNKDVAFSVFLYAQFYSLFINHVLPVKAGDAVRIGLLAKEKDVQWDESLHSVVVMRSLDLLVLAAYAGIGVFWMGLAYAWTTLFLVAGIGAAGLVVLLRWGMKKPLLKKTCADRQNSLYGPQRMVHLCGDCCQLGAGSVCCAGSDECLVHRSFRTERSLGKQHDDRRAAVSFYAWRVGYV